ncbi:MAG: hypothetical protein P0Y58_15345 [Candidatus Pseudomonas phytovorans]|uniref:Uncharacterized protein n=1 Tax=Candidatus Pseudomonas phytovorans TaxID=3121377 RepID=A0AAJ5WCI9_9PSED|nr:hypothetical protein [Pseudomonas sp.]WEK28285.1 MAG: hypothetical protein P0Y58_15345 [Pseudomonas sp.]
MSHEPMDVTDLQSAFAVEFRFIQSYFNIRWEWVFERKGWESTGDNGSVWKLRRLVENHWEGVFLALGYPRLSYSGDGTNDELQVRRNIVGGIVRVQASEHVNLVGREVRRVALEGRDGGLSFDMKVRAGLQAHLEYSASDGYLRLYWDNPAEFESSSGLGDVIEILKEHYNRERTMLLRKLKEPFNSTMRDVRINMQALPDNNAQYMIFGVLPKAGAQAVVPTKFPLSTVSHVVLGFNDTVFTNLRAGRQPVDKNWVISLFLPDDAWRCMSGPEKYAENFYSCDYVTNNPSKVASESAAPSAELQITPLSQVFAVGAQRILLTLAPAAANAQWVLEGEARGLLEKEGADYYYKAPLQIEPEAVFNNNTELLIAPAYRANLQSPVRVDKVKATVGSSVAYSTFVTHIVPPTHIIRVAKSGVQLKLSLWYYNGREKKELQVPEGNITWRVVAGDGRVSDEGIFTPGSEPCNTVVGIDERNQDEWRWGATILPYPLMHADEVVSLIQG